MSIEARVREILDEHAALGTSADSLSDEADLYAAGMTSHANIKVILAIEDEFDVAFPEAMLNRRVFESIASITAALQELGTVSVA